MARSSLFRTALAVVVLAGGVVQAGGWVVVTVQNLPDHVAVGAPVTLSYAVRQHGRNLVGGLSGRVEARAGGWRVTADAVAAAQPGHYSARLTLPVAGDWTIAIDSGFGGNYDSTSTVLTAIDVGAPAPLLSDAERGQRLFTGKGCISCHAHPKVAGTSVSAGPPFSGNRQYQPDYLKGILANPPAARPDGWQMPNLGLSDSEIASLVAFIRM
jgi:Cytochrome C oxidase, cbb3-type, subunit III